MEITKIEFNKCPVCKGDIEGSCMERYDEKYLYLKACDKSGCKGRRFEIPTDKLLFKRSDIMRLKKELEK